MAVMRKKALLKQDFFLFRYSLNIKKSQSCLWDFCSFSLFYR
ncbi:hypothetical protein FEDK69T_24560 [Flavobacterium enshiense DK69]|nr:hypothetical protein FEDK69T_24560 [Flavobacterium enshiense DK69]